MIIMCLIREIIVNLYVMNDNSCTDQRRRNMAAIRSASTEPEILLRHALWRHGFRYRVNDKRLPGSPDIVLPMYRTVIFVHGCFWHGHKDCPRYVIPKTNTEFWVNKVARNQERDEEKWRQLEAKDWSVIIVWECELEKKTLDSTISRVKNELEENGREHQRRKEERRLIRQQHLLERREQKMRQKQLLSELDQAKNNHDARK